MKNVHRHTLGKLLSPKIWCPFIFSSLFGSKSIILVLVVHGRHEVQQCGRQVTSFVLGPHQACYIIFLWSKKGLSFPLQFKYTAAEWLWGCKSFLVSTIDFFVIWKQWSNSAAYLPCAISLYLHQGCFRQHTAPWLVHTCTTNSHWFSIMFFC